MSGETIFATTFLPISSASFAASSALVASPSRRRRDPVRVADPLALWGGERVPTRGPYFVEDLADGVFVHWGQVAVMILRSLHSP